MIFSEQLAIMMTGNSAARKLIERAMDAGNFIEKKNDLYSIQFPFCDSLRSKAVKEFPQSELKNFALLAGGYYEANNEDDKALELYVKYGENGRIREILLRNARKCPESGYYIEMRRYYLMLSDEDISGSTNILDLIKSCYSMLKDRSIPMPQFSVTSNQPSLMNGGKDFCEWSKHDREIALSAGKIVCAFLGKYGKGLVNASLAESFFEKGGDPYEVISLVSKAKLEAETGGKLELCFATNAILIRQHLVSGNPDAAKSVLDSFEKVAKRDGLKRLLPTIEAMHCRIALMEGDSAIVENWLKTAPNENEAFIAMERYLYLTKIRCYIAADELEKAFSLIESTRFYAEKCDQKFIAMELSILTAIVMYRRGSAW